MCTRHEFQWGCNNATEVGDSGNEDWVEDYGYDRDGDAGIIITIVIVRCGIRRCSGRAEQAIGEWVKWV